MLTLAGPRRANLQVARPDFFALDRDKILAHARSYRVPADTLTELIALSKFKIDAMPLNGKRRLAALDAHSRTLWICSNLREKLDHPNSYDHVLVFTLAHELAHIRLHFAVMLAGTAQQQHEDEANAYAAIFLMPAQMVGERPQMQEMLDFGFNYTSQHLWVLVGQMATWFRVSPSAMARRLEELGAIRIDRFTRELRVAA